ncbi:MAG: HEAT repeat domain-containing protein [Candidatus Freyarchaeota archaeon]|nr:HEAT repeat domain-containing protein [Candidatus Jordarchaeia archaeon]
MKEKLFEKLGGLLLSGNEEGALEILKKLMRDEDPEVRVASLTVVDASMKRFYKVVEGAFPLVLKMTLSDPHVYVRGNALEVVGRASHCVPEIVRRHLPEVVLSIRSQDSDLAWNAVVTLGWIGGSNPELIAPFMDQIGDSLNSRSEVARSASAMAIGWIGGVSPELVEKYVPQLVDMAKSCDVEEVRLSVMDALASISHANAKLLEGFLGDVALIALGDKNENIRGSALEAVIEVCKCFPEKAGAVTSSVLDSLSNEEAVNWKAIATLGLIGAESPNAIPYMLAELMRRLREPSNTIKVIATLTMGWILGNNPEASAREAEKVIDKVAVLLKDKSPEVRRSAVEAIGWMSANNLALLEKYMSVVFGMASKEKDETVRKKAEETVEFMKERLKQFNKDR